MLAARALGAVVEGVDLAEAERHGEAAAAAAFARVQEELHHHGVVVLKRQGFSREAMHRFAQRFGPIGLRLGQQPNEFEGLPGMLTLADGVGQSEGGARNFGPNCAAPASSTRTLATVLTDLGSRVR